MTTPYELSPQQHDAVTALDGPLRYQHFIGRIADTQVVYGLRTNEGWVSACDDDGAEGLPLWPHPAYANACATGEWAGSTAASIDVFDFADDWLPTMVERGIKAIVFPTPVMRGVLVDPARLGADLEEELTQY